MSRREYLAISKVCLVFNPFKRQGETCLQLFDLEVTENGSQGRHRKRVGRQNSLWMRECTIKSLVFELLPTRQPEKYFQIAVILICRG